VSIAAPANGHTQRHGWGGAGRSTGGSASVLPAQQHGSLAKFAAIRRASSRASRLVPEQRSAFYTPDWKHIPVAYKHAPIQRARPGNLEDMIGVAEAIAEGMEFARVDLYSDRKSRIRFGEITFTLGNACSRFSDFKFDRWLGSQFGKGPRNNVPCGF